MFRSGVVQRVQSCVSRHHLRQHCSYLMGGVCKSLQTHQGPHGGGGAGGARGRDGQHLWPVAGQLRQRRWRSRGPHICPSLRTLLRVEDRTNVSACRHGSLLIEHTCAARAAQQCGLRRLASSAVRRGSCDVQRSCSTPARRRGILLLSRRRGHVGQPRGQHRGGRRV
jgi:hypothetical protein